ncbi:MAG: alanyl-tRNA editing protein [Oscillibacter sp.]
METEKLYYADPFLQSFTATVLSCAPGKEGFLVALDRSAFYPEGGGQPADWGELNGIAVTDVHEKEGVIFHKLDKAVEIGTAVTGKIDWNRRFDHMQQHSGEHILSGILCRDYHCDNVGFHMGSDCVTIDYNAEISWEQALAAEAEANAVIWADRAVEIAYPSSAALADMDYRSKKELTGQVRIVTFPSADCCACCGTHVLRSGQVGMVKLLSCQKFRSGVRLELLCGKRALDFFSAMYEQNRAIARQLSVKPVDTFAAVERLQGELNDAKACVSDLEDRVFAGLAAQYAGSGDALVFFTPLRPDAVRRLSDAIGGCCGGLSAVFAGENDSWNYALIRSDGAELSPFVKTLNAALHGRGGGRGGFAQGSVQAKRGEIEAFFGK